MVKDRKKQVLFYTPKKKLSFYHKNQKHILPNKDNK